MYLIWVDLDTKKPTATKIAEGYARYQDRFGTPASVILVNEGVTLTIAGLDIRPLARIGPNNFHIGAAGAPDAPPR
jgi:hypothetical protein